MSAANHRNYAAAAIRVPQLLTRALPSFKTVPITPTLPIRPSQTGPGKLLLSTRGNRSPAKQSVRAHPPGPCALAQTNPPDVSSQPGRRLTAHEVIEGCLGCTALGGHHLENGLSVPDF